MSQRQAIEAGAMLALSVFLLQLSGCAATQVALSKKDLVVQTKMSDSVFLDPVEPDQQTIHVILRNTTGQDFKVGTYMRESLEGAGFQIVKSPSKARFRLQVNVLSLEQTTLTASQAANMGFGGGMGGVGVAVGAVSGGVSDGYRGAAIGGVVGGLVGGGLEMITGSMVKDITFMLITDIELVEMAPDGAFVRTDMQMDHKEGLGGTSQQTSSSVSDKIKYRVRIVSTANKVNLKKEEAIPPMAEGIARALTGMFGGESI